jgi:hypothetical protein
VSKPEAQPCAPDQDVYLPPRQAQWVCGVVGDLMTDEIKCRKRPYDIHSLSCPLPGGIR